MTFDITSLNARLRTYERERRAARQADTPRRLAALNRENAAYWTGVVRRAAPHTAEADAPRPCHYGPWSAALLKIERVDREWKSLERYYHHGQDAVASDLIGGLMSFVYDAMCPGWPDDHAHLVEFALTFLEADVMLFRSGYYKRHLLRRLRQAELTPEQAERAAALVKQAVNRGTGLEEFREVARLARRLETEDLREWLSQRAEGAYLTMNDLDAEDREEFYRFADETLMRKMLRHDRNYRFQNLISGDLSPPPIALADVPDDNRVRKNARKISRYLDGKGWPL